MPRASEYRESKYVKDVARLDKINEYPRICVITINIIFYINSMKK